MEHYPGLADSPPLYYSFENESTSKINHNSNHYDYARHAHNDRNEYNEASSLASVNPLGKATTIFDVPDPIFSYSFTKNKSLTKPAKRSALVGDISFESKKPSTSFPQEVPLVSSGFGLGVGRYGNEIPSPIDSEIQQSILEMQQELAYTESSPSLESLKHSVRLLKERCYKLENSVDPDWVEVDINKPIRVTKRVLIPYFRHPNVNYVGRILGPKGITLQNICKKYKASISIQGAGSTKDPKKELELLNSGDPKYGHYATPLHIRLDVVAAPHVAHMRLAGCLNVLHKLLSPIREVSIEGITTEKGKSENKEAEEDLLEKEFTFENNESKKGLSQKRSFAQISRGRGRGLSTLSKRGGRGGFVPKIRARGSEH